YLYRQNRRSQLQVRKMMKELDSLQKAEDSLLEMQMQLDKARIEQENLQEEISNKKKDGLAYSDPDNMIYKLQEEVRLLHEELAKAQNMPRGMAHPQLQHWLQLTHEIELKNYLTKKAAAENQLRKAKEECEKLRRKGQSFMGPFRLTHGGSIDDIDTTILKAKQALSEVTHDLTERLHRWRQIEMLCGFNIVSNRGLVQLEALLHGRAIIANATHGHPGTSSVGHSSSNNNNNNNTPTAGSTKSVISRSGSEGTLSEDDSPGSSYYNNNNNMSSVNQLLRGSTAILLAPSLRHQCCLDQQGLLVGVTVSHPGSGVRGSAVSGADRARSRTVCPETTDPHSVASTPSMSMMSAKTANAVFGVPPPGRRVQAPQTLYGDYYAQQIMQQSIHNSLMGHHTLAGAPGPGVGLPSAGVGGVGQVSMMPSPGTPSGSVSSHLRREELDGDLTSQIGQGPVLFQIGADGASPTMSESGSVYGAPVVSPSRGILLKGTSLDGSTDGVPDEDLSVNKANSGKPKRKGSALMNAIRSSFTSASTLVDSEDNSSRGSTPALDDTGGQHRVPRKRSGVLGAIKKISRGSKDKATPDRDS
ncbi:stromal interaction molecule-like, partial [Tropilaelaps mercedesae]